MYILSIKYLVHGIPRYVGDAVMISLNMDLHKITQMNSGSEFMRQKVTKISLLAHILNTAHVLNRIKNKYRLEYLDIWLRDHSFKTSANFHDF